MPVTGGGKLKSAIATIRKAGKRFADVEDLTEEELRRRGAAADALWREVMHRVREDRQ